MATLVHDDVIDKSDKRRGKLTIEKNGMLLPLSNWQFLTSFGLKQLSKIGDRVHTIISNAQLLMFVEASSLIQDQFNSHQNITNYLGINRKTALLIQLSTEVE